ncbi:hypothetical protein DGG96_00840 [Legionella qingyii]|uniref:Uncharacterized protein n=1 Tax=Legionella qingyii TaxID=2184757 RepID=A0A317U6U7_9GAMM|nr:hypothetical protein [Legionella qingyii]PWY57673.1 hypothetical protein DGG96_00840 [Legionella qingyii]RUR25860.1 hypothetical protein ELY20_01550 [Legionella qingyii]RUR29249.1 hypothetical protein ELY16_00175 [Legionella qingyii]
MKLFRMMLLGLLLSTALITQASAAPTEDYDFQQERMKLTPDSVMVISTFDSQDHVTAYTYAGVRLWNVPFHAKILSWQIAGDYVFIFSKDRKGTKTYITCLNRHTGAPIWQKP